MLLITPFVNLPRHLTLNTLNSGFGNLKMFYTCKGIHYLGGNTFFYCTTKSCVFTERSFGVGYWCDSRNFAGILTPIAQRTLVQLM